MRLISEHNSFSVSSTVKNTPKIDGVFFASIKDKVLGKKYELSLAFVGVKRARAINKAHRQKDYATDILSFGLDEESGEIIMNPQKVAKKAKEFGRSYENYLVFLFIHGLFHLKGFDHGSRMESEEARVRRLFNI